MFSHPTLLTVLAEKLSNVLTGCTGIATSFAPSYVTFVILRTSIVIVMDVSEITEYMAAPNSALCFDFLNIFFIIQPHSRGHGGRVVTLSPPTSEVGVLSQAWPQVGKLVVACRWSAVYSTEP